VADDWFDSVATFECAFQSSCIHTALLPGLCFGFKRLARGVLNTSILPLVSWDFGFTLNKNLQEINIYFTSFLQLLPAFLFKY
jgi:hypothetical protein